LQANLQKAFFFEFPNIELPGKTFFSRFLSHWCVVVCGALWCCGVGVLWCVVRCGVVVLVCCGVVCCGVTGSIPEYNTTMAQTTQHSTTQQQSCQQHNPMSCDTTQHSTTQHSTTQQHKHNHVNNAIQATQHNTT
jgi:hypothetical protein